MNGLDPRIYDALARLPDYLGSHVLVSVSALALGLAVSLPKGGAWMIGIKWVSGVVLADYRHIVYAFPSSGCAWRGYGSIGGMPAEAWINGSVQPLFATQARAPAERLAARTARRASRVPSIESSDGRKRSLHLYFSAKSSSGRFCPSAARRVTMRSTLRAVTSSSEGTDSSPTSTW